MAGAARVSAHSNARSSLLLSPGASSPRHHRPWDVHQQGGFFDRDSSRGGSYMGEPLTRAGSAAAAAMRGMGAYVRSSFAAGRAAFSFARRGSFGVPVRKGWKCSVSGNGCSCMTGCRNAYVGACMHASGCACACLRACVCVCACVRVVRQVRVRFTPNTVRGRLRDFQPLMAL